MTTAAELHNAMFDAIQARDFKNLHKLFDAHSVHVSGDGVAVFGPDPVIAEVEKMTSAFPDLAITIRNQHVPDHTVSVIEYSFSGTHRGTLEGLQPTGRTVSVVACSILEAEGDRIVREADYYDTTALMAQLEQ
jgi:steroid delta-isomerase-like uncharacterized protein